MRYLVGALITMSCAAAVGCFEEPVREHVHLTVLGGGATVVTTVQEVAAPWQAGSNPALARRLDDARSEIEGGWDRWRSLYDQLEPAAERYSIELVDRLLRRATYSAVVPSFAPVERFLGAEGLSAVLDTYGPIHELRIYPAAATRATSRQRQQADAEIERWAEVVAEYLRHSIALYAYLERRPDRAVPCLSHVADSHGPASGPLNGREERLVLALKPAIEAVVDVLLVPEDQAFSPNELARLAFDPFPARLTVAVEGRIESCIGFRDHDGVLERPQVDLWSALLATADRWLSPDLVTAMAAPAPDDQQPDFDPEGFALLPRRFSTPPQAQEVAAVLREGLVPPDVYVARWRPFDATAPDFESVDARRYLNAAEARVLR